MWPGAATSDRAVADWQGAGGTAPHTPSCGLSGQHWWPVPGKQLDPRGHILQQVGDHTLSRARAAGAPLSGARALSAWAPAALVALVGESEPVSGGWQDCVRKKCLPNLDKEVTKTTLLLSIHSCCPHIQRNSVGTVMSYVCCYVGHVSYITSWHGNHETMKPYTILCMVSQCQFTVSGNEINLFLQSLLITCSTNMLQCLQVRYSKYAIFPVFLEFLDWLKIRYIALNLEIAHLKKMFGVWKKISLLFKNNEHTVSKQLYLVSQPWEHLCDIICTI